MRKFTSFALPTVIGLALLWQPTAQAQGHNPECLGVTCSAPHQQGGACGGCGSCGVWVNGTGQQNTIANTDDCDSDGVPDQLDNCVCTSNPNQNDRDGDGVGDECDNCPDDFNPRQEKHQNLNRNGDACNRIPTGPYAGQLDADGDGVPDNIDNCKFVANPDQANDDPGQPNGNACNPLLCAHRPSHPDCVNAIDTDGDGIPDRFDICPTVYNPGQEVNPYSGKGVACNSGVGQDLDGDGVVNEKDNCIALPNPNQNNNNHASNPDSLAKFGVDTGIGDGCYNNNPVFYAGQWTNGVAKTGVPVDPRGPAMFTLGGKWNLPKAGQTYRLQVIGNRNNAAADYKAIVVGAPEGSNATVINPVGVFTHSDNFVYASDPALAFTPDKEGEYRIRLVTTLSFDDRAYPSVKTSTDEAIFVVGPNSGSNGHAGSCSAVPAGIPAIGVGIALLGILRRRRR